MYCCGFFLEIWSQLINTHVSVTASALFVFFSCLNLQVVNGMEIYSMKIDSKVTSRFAHNVITSRAVNRGNVSKEVFFDVELPKTAFITNFSMCVIFTILLKKTKNLC